MSKYKINTYFIDLPMTAAVTVGLGSMVMENYMVR
jgi:hypothetical protein